jgi:hypothetical protein
MEQTRQRGPVLRKDSQYRSEPNEAKGTWVSNCSELVGDTGSNL